jgi:purine-binding chemotaxis protein CheW
MDLAKIRQKSRQDRECRETEEQLTPKEESVTAFVDDISTAACQPPVESDYFDAVQSSPVTASQPAYLQEVSPLRRVQKDPLAAILAGRAVAGCDESHSDALDEQEGGATDSYRKYLCFRVADEVYGIDIMEIKELIKPREVTEVPRTPAFVSGVISLRGVIIPIIDMRQRLGLARESVTGRERVIVVRHTDSFSGLLVDEIIQVVRIDEESVEPAPTVLDGIDRDFVTGIGRADSRMIILLNIGNITDIDLY